MRSDGTLIEKIVGRLKESFCLILLGIGFALLFFYIDQGTFYEPTDMQNLLLLMIGSFGSYVFLIDLFFGEDRKPIMQRHLLFVVSIFLILGFLSLVNAAEKGIELENMPIELPLLDSVVGLFLISFLMIFIVFLLADGVIELIKRVKESRSVL